MTTQQHRTWEDVRKLAESLEFDMEDHTHDEDDDGVILKKRGGGEEGWYQDSQQGIDAAYQRLLDVRGNWDWTEEQRRKLGQ